MERRVWDLFNNQRLCFLGKLLFLFFSFLISSCNYQIKYYGLNEQFDLENGKVVLRDFEILSYDELGDDKLLVLNYNFVGFSNSFLFVNDNFKIDEPIQYSSEKYNKLINGYDIIYRGASAKPEKNNELDADNSFEYKIAFIISLNNREDKTFKHDYFIGHFFNLYSKVSKENVELKYLYLE